MDTINIDDLSKALYEIATRSSKETVDRINKGIDDISAETLQKVKEESPVYDGKSKKLKKGKYRNSWEISEVYSKGIYQKIIHNKQYQLVHLLELGHLLKDGTGRIYGEVPPYKHVETAENLAEEKVDALLRGV